MKYTTPLAWRKENQHCPPRAAADPSHLAPTHAPPSTRGARYGAALRGAVATWQHEPHRRPAGGWGRRQWPLRAWRDGTLDASVRRQVVGAHGEEGAGLNGWQWGRRRTGVLVTLSVNARCAA